MILQDLSYKQYNIVVVWQFPLAFSKDRRKDLRSKMTGLTDLQ